MAGIFEAVIHTTFEYRWWFIAAAILLIGLWLLRLIGPPRIRGRLRLLGRVFHLDAILGVASAVLGIIGFFYSPVTFVLVAAYNTDLLLNTSAQIGLRLRQKDGTETTPEGYPCVYSSNPAIPVEDWNVQAGCKLIVTNAPAFFATGRQSPAKLKISMAPPRYSWEGPDPIGLTLYNIAQPRVAISQGKYGLGATVDASIAFPNGPSPSAFSCAWRPVDDFTSPDQCMTKFVVPRRGSALSSPSIEVFAVVSFDSKRFETEHLKIEIVPPPPNLLQIVLDTSARMAVQLPNGTAFFEVARSAIADDVRAYAEQGGWLSVIGFGKGAVPSAKTCNDAVGSIYPLSSVDSTIAEQNLKAVTIAGLEAPLGTAIQRAADEYRNDRPLYADDDPQRMYVFALITAGGTSCDHVNLAGAIRQIGAAFDQRGLREHLGSTGSLSFVIVKGGGEAELVYHDSSYQERRTILLIVKDDKELREMVTALANLFDVRPEIRGNACKQLLAPLEQLGDKFHVETLKRSRPCAGA